MTQNEMQCPACGSPNIVRTEVENTDQLTLGPEFAFKEVRHKCSICGEEGDFSAETDANYSVAQKNAQGGLVKRLIEDMGQHNISMAFFERAFELPMRTVTRWKTGDFSASAIALLRVAVTFPWIAEVAEHRFESNVARAILVREAATVLGRVAEETPGASFEFGARADSTTFCAVAKFSVSKQQGPIVPKTTVLLASGG